MIYYVNNSAPKNGNGTKEMPFKFINDAAKIAKAGDEVLVAPGIYHEYVDPVNGGTEDARIVYKSEKPLGAGVTIAKGAVVKDSIVMQGSVIGASTSVEKAIIAENVKVGSDVQIGVGEYAPSIYDQKVYQFDLATIGENSIIPDGVKVGKNTAIAGETTVGDYPDGLLASGNYIIKAGGVK